MTALVTENLLLVSSAPNGFKKLRQLVLTLAVQGRLVPQDHSEQPAAEFLNRVAAHKADAAARGRSRRPIEIIEPMESAAAPVAPAGWLWTTFGSATVCRDGERIPVSQLDREQRQKLYDYYGASGVIDKIDGYLFDKPLLLIGEDGANLVNRSSPIAFIARGLYWVNNHAHVIDGVTEGLLKYLELYINAIDLKPYVTGTAQPKMNQAKLNAIPLALPPEAEQHRIVAKVDELMALCDRLEAEQADAETAHVKLLDALLASLTQARDVADFRASWQQLSEHFHTLFTTEDSIKALRQALIDLGISGRFSGLYDTECIPDGWANARLGDVVVSSGAGWSPSCEGRPRVGDEWGVLKVSAVSWSVFRPEENKALPAHLEPRPELQVQAGDFLVSRANTVELVARSVLVTSAPQRLMLSDKIVRLKLSAACCPQFVQLANSSTSARSYYASVAGGTSSSMKNVSRSQILALPILLPPLTEQLSIVAKVDELLGLCDLLRRGLAESRVSREHVAAVLVEQAAAVA